MSAIYSVFLVSVSDIKSINQNLRRAAIYSLLLVITIYSLLLVINLDMYTISSVFAQILSIFSAFT